MRTLVSWHQHISNGGLSLSVKEDDGCVTIETQFDHCEHSHSSCLFCGSDVGPEELDIIGQLFKDAAETLRKEK